jgi:aspartyl-tRNA(Asn)/glutamyl-tRNA(Gln) amidotransferase subunit B
VQALVGSEKTTWEDAKLDPKAFRELALLVLDSKVSSTGAKVILEELVTRGGDVVTIAKAKNVLQVSDEGEIAKIVAKVLADNAQAAEDVKSGEMKAIGFLVGQVMKASQGKANPGLAQQLIKKQLGL